MSSPIVTQAQVQNPFGEPTALQPKVAHTNFKIELVSTLKGFPTNMAFIGPDDILILSKNTGQVFRIKDGNNIGSVLKIDVTGRDEMGLLGIATDAYNKNKNQKNDNNVFLYYSLCASEEQRNNFVYKYMWNQNDGKLENPKLLLMLPALPGPSHMGGDIALGPDGYLYLTIGDLLSSDQFNKDKKYNTQAQNYVDGVKADGRAGILGITQDGKPVGNGTIGSTYPLNLYYAYGIKNSFGIGFDPVSSKLWDTENGPSFGDEINLVEPGFNGGWSKVQGFWTINAETGDKMAPIKGKPMELVDFQGKGKYHEPKLVWDRTVAPTALVFLNSMKLGSQYFNDIFVGSVEGGRIFHLDVNENRIDLTLPSSISDKFVAESEESEILFADGFGIVTDLQVGPDDGYLYVIGGDRPTKTGALYRIVPQ